MKHNYLKRFVAMVTCLVFAASCAYIGTFRQGVSHADTVTTHANQFYIVGTKIIDPDGKVFVPIGANVGSQPNNFDWAGGAAGQSAAAQAWGWNTVRLNVACTTAESYSRVNAKDGDKVLLADIAKIVNEYTAKKIVVMIECHDVKRNANDAANFWTDIANIYKNNPYVWFNYANEPEWSDNNTWIAEQKQWLALIRSTGAENIFVADVMNAGNDAGWAGGKPIYDASMGPALATGQCNVLMSLHNYGGQANSADDVMRPGAYQTYWQRVQAANLAMVVGEFGMDYRLAFQAQSNGTAKVVATDGKSDPKKIGNDAYNHTANGEYSTINYAKNYGIGMLMWHATFADNLILASPAGGITLPSGSGSGKPNFYNILNAGKTGTQTGFSFSQIGADMWSAGHNKPAAATFGGDYAAAHCASVKTSTAAKPTPLPPAPIVLKPVGSTPSVSNPVVAEAAQFGVRAHDADPLLKASYTSVSSPNPITSSVPAGTPSVSTPAATSATPAAATTSGDPTATTNPATASKQPAKLFSLAGRDVNTQQVGYYGGGGFLGVLVLIVAYHILDITRSRRLYAQHHQPIHDVDSNSLAPPVRAVVSAAPKAKPDIPTEQPPFAARPTHEPGAVIRPDSSPKD